MKFRKILFTTALAAITTATALAAGPKDKPAATVLQDLIQRLNINVTDLEDETLKIKFMLNEKREIIILGTDDKNMDSYIKSALNYKTVETSELKPFSVYVVPVTFEEA